MTSICVDLCVQRKRTFPFIHMFTTIACLIFFSCIGKQLPTTLSSQGRILVSTSLISLFLQKWLTRKYLYSSYLLVTTIVEFSNDIHHAITTQEITHLFDDDTIDCCFMTTTVACQNVAPIQVHHATCVIATVIVSAVALILVDTLSHHK